MENHDIKKLLKEAVEKAYNNVINDSKIDIYDEIDKEINKISDTYSVNNDYLEYDSVNVKYNPSYLFDFNVFKKSDYTYDYIVNNQFFLIDDCGHFTATEAFRDNSKYTLYVPYEEFHQCNDCFRVYLVDNKTRFMIPIIASEETEFKNFPEYGISDSFYNEICCLISNSIRLLKDIMNGNRYAFEVCPLQNILYDDETGCSTTLLVFENCKDTTKPYIRYQHNWSHNVNNWKTLFIDYLSESEPELIRCFVRHNDEILKRLFDFNDSYNIEQFKLDYERIDKHGNMKTEPNKIYLSEHKNIRAIKIINKDTFIIMDKKMRQFNLLIKGHPKFDTWFDYLEFINNQNKIKGIIDDKEMFIDIKGNIIK